MQFIEKWHELTPGVGAAYEPNTNILKDIAIVVSKVSPMQVDVPIMAAQAEEEPSLYLKYFPRQGLPSTQEGRFKALFKERSKWKLVDLEPYAEDLVENSSFKTVQELLVKYAKVAPKEDGEEEDVDWYIAN